MPCQREAFAGVNEGEEIGGAIWPSAFTTYTQYILFGCSEKRMVVSADTMIMIRTRTRQSLLQ